MTTITTAAELRVCSREGCARAHHAHGVCKAHYKALVRQGCVPPRKTPAERFWAKVDTSSGCWLWTGKTDRGGYGRFKVLGRLVNAHRWAWESERGPIPEGMEIDHVCRTHGCVNPDHMEVVTPSINKARRWSRARSEA